MKKKSIPALIQILFCISLFVFPLYMMSRSGELDPTHYWMYFVRTAILVLLFYINYFFLIDQFLFNKKFIAFILLNIVISIGLQFFQDILIEYFVRPQPPPLPGDGFKKPGQPLAPYMRYWGNMLVFILVIGLGVALKATLRWYQDSMKMEKIKAAQLEADLRNLRNQLNPHFLFNTLNNIYSLAATDSNKAQESILRLSNLLRYVLYENDSPFIPLSLDLNFTKDYINLMKLRITPNVKLDVSIIGDDTKDEIAPLMFMTLIENAFKHGVSDDKESYIDINILIAAGKGVICSIKNSINKGENLEAKNSGIGLPNLRRRLELLYPKKHDLMIEKRNDQFTAQLRIDFDNKEVSNET